MPVSFGIGHVMVRERIPPITLLVRRLSIFWIQMRRGRIPSPALLAGEGEGEGTFLTDCLTQSRGATRGCRTRNPHPTLSRQ